MPKAKAPKANKKGFLVTVTDLDTNKQYDAGKVDKAGLAKKGLDKAKK